MSLIQDALKRKSEEIPKPSPPELPKKKPVPADEDASPKSPKPVLIIWIVLLIIALLVALGGLAFSLLRSGKQTHASGSAPTAPASEAPKEDPVIPPDPPPPSAAPFVVDQPAVDPWPVLKLTGIASSDNKRIAIINGKMLAVGRAIGEVIVREVHDHQAVVEFRGERRVLNVNE